MKLRSQRESRIGKPLAKEMLGPVETEAELRFDPDKEIDGPTWKMILGEIEEVIDEEGNTILNLWKIIHAATALIIAGENPARQSQVRVSIGKVIPPTDLVKKIRSDLQMTTRYYKNGPRLLESMRLLGGDYMNAYAQVAGLFNLTEELNEGRNFYYQSEIPYIAHFLSVEPKPELGPLFFNAPELIVRMLRLADDEGDEQEEIIDELGRMRLADPQRFLEITIPQPVRQKIIDRTRYNIKTIQDQSAYETELFYIAQAVIVLARDFTVTPNGVSTTIHGTSRNFKAARLPDRSIT